MVSSLVNYNSNETCYEVTFTATVVGIPVNINVSVDRVNIYSKCLELQLGLENTLFWFEAGFDSKSKTLKQEKSSSLLMMA